MCTFFLSVMLYFLTYIPCDAQPESRGLKTLRSQANRRIAICIGINHSTDPKLNTLKKAANDAYGLASVQEQKGDFRTYIFFDLDRDWRGKPISARMLPASHTLDSGPAYVKELTEYFLTITTLQLYNRSVPCDASYCMP